MAKNLKNKVTQIEAQYDARLSRVEMLVRDLSPAMSPSPVAEPSRFPSAINECSPPKPREIPEAINNLRMKISDLEDITSGLIDRLSPITVAEVQASPTGSGIGAAPYGCEGAGTIFNLQTRVDNVLARLRSLYDRVQV